MTPATLNFDIQRKQPLVGSIRFRGLDFTGATMVMQFRLNRPVEGSDVIDLANATAGTEGLSVAVTDESGVTISTVTFQVDQTTVDGVLPFTVDVDGRPNRKTYDPDLPLYYHLTITGGGLLKNRWVQGVATIREGGEF